MPIRRITLSNFKSFDRIDVELANLNILIGANASGKSSFIQILKFIKDMVAFGLDNAVSMQGGAEYLLNRKLGSSREFILDIVSDTSEGSRPTTYKTRKEYGYEAFETSYRIILSFSERGKRFEILEESVKQKCNFYIYLKSEQKKLEKRELGEGEISVNRLKGSPRLVMKLPSGLQEKELIEDVIELYIASKYLSKTKLRSKQSYLEAPLHIPYQIGTKLVDTLRRISIYDFDPRLSKRAQLITGRAELESDGSNLAVVINNLLKNKDRQQKFYNLLCDLLPFVERFRIQNIADTVLFTLSEKYAKGRPFPAFLLSDGTINLTSLIICLFFEDKSLKVIEEPERNIHPHLISKVMNLMREASRDAQIVTTTHNPEVVRHSDINDLMLVFRKRNGFSNIERPADRERVKTFLKQEMGIEELYVQNLL
jgi:predicted ATPase